MNGYINIELGGVMRGIKFGNRALLDVMAKHKIGSTEGSTLVFSFDLVVDLVYFGLINNCMLSRQNVDFTEDEVTLWVDDIPMAKLMIIFEAFQKSYTGETEAGSKKIVKSATTKK